MVIQVRLPLWQPYELASIFAACATQYEFESRSSQFFGQVYCVF
jgi:hypothetical protein